MRGNPALRDRFDASSATHEPPCPPTRESHPRFRAPDRHSGHTHPMRIKDGEVPPWLADGSVGGAGSGVDGYVQPLTVEHGTVHVAAVGILSRVTSLGETRPTAGTNTVRSTLVQSLEPRRLAPDRSGRHPFAAGIQQPSGPTPLSGWSPLPDPVRCKRGLTDVSPMTRPPKPGRDWRRACGVRSAHGCTSLHRQRTGPSRVLARARPTTLALLPVLRDRPAPERPLVAGQPRAVTSIVVLAALAIKGFQTQGCCSVNG